MNSRMDATGWVRAVEVGLEAAVPGGTNAQILRSCSVDISPGFLTAIVGPSGAGKSSLLYSLSGLESPGHGKVFLGGCDIYALSRQKRAVYLREQVGFVFQQYNLVPYLTLEQNIVLPLDLAGRRTHRRDLEVLLEYFGLSDIRDSNASAVSGGEQQRAALCRAMLLNPPLVFADEPTGALDSWNTGLVLDMLRELVRRGTNVVMVTHDLAAASRADRVVFMRDGEITRTSGQLTATEVLAYMEDAGTAGSSENRGPQ